MNNYKFGNYICKLREEHNYTQKEFARILDVSDKAVSKWENGQAIPRMDTMEKIAEALGTSVEDLLMAGKENINRICFVNQFCDVMHLDIDGQLISIKLGEEQWVEVEKEKSRHIVSISGDLNFKELNEGFEDAPIKEKLISRGLTKLMKKTFENQILQCDCTYTLDNTADNSKVEIEFDSFSIGDKAWLGSEFFISYPKLNIENGSYNLLKARGKNAKEVLRKFKKESLTREIGIDIPLMLIAFPFRMMYFRNVCKPKNLKTYITKADYYNKKEKRVRKHKHPFLRGVSIVILIIIGFFAIDMALDVINVETEKPALVAADYSSIELFRDNYQKIDELPFDAAESKKLGMNVWYDARLDGQSKLDQAFSDNKVTIYEDTEGTKYLWLVCDYIETITDENGEYKDYEGFDSHLVYKIKE